MKTRFLLMLALVCVIDRSPVVAQSRDTLGVVDTLQIGHATGSPGRRVKLPIRVTNDFELISLTVPVVYPSSRLHADSVSFAGGRISHFGVLNPIIDQAQGRMGNGHTLREGRYGYPVAATA